MSYLENLVAHDQMMPSDFNTQTEEKYFSLLQSKNLGKVLTNISEYLLELEGMDGKSKVRLNFVNAQNPAFWFRLGLKYFESVSP